MTHDQAPCCNISSTWVKNRINGIIPPHIHTSTMEFMSIWLSLCTPILWTWHKYICRHGFSCKCMNHVYLHLCHVSSCNKVLNILDTFSFHDLLWMNITILHLDALQGLSYIKDFKTVIISINTYNINICNAEYNLFHSSDKFVLVHRWLFVLL